MDWGQVQYKEFDNKDYKQANWGKVQYNEFGNDDYKAALIDQIIEAAQDINFLVTLSGRDKDPEKKRSARNILTNKHLPKWFEFLENILNFHLLMPLF